MTIVLNLADGVTEVYEKKTYSAGPYKTFHPAICSVTIFSEGKKVLTRKRPFVWFYKLFTFKSKKVQEELKRINQVELKPEN